MGKKIVIVVKKGNVFSPTLPDAKIGGGDDIEVFEIMNNFDFGVVGEEF